MPITVLDGIVIAVILISAVLAMIRGLVREVLSLASWAIAAASAYFLYPVLLPLAKEHIAEDVIAKGVVIGGTFILVLLIVSYVTMRISDFMLDSQIGALDRSLGFLFGAARGLLLIVILALFFNWLVAPDRQPNWIATAKTKPLVDSLGTRLIAALPEDLESQFLDTLKSRVLGKNPSSGTEQPDQDGTPPPETGYRDSERQGLDQLIENSDRAQ